MHKSESAAECGLLQYSSYVYTSFYAVICSGLNVQLHCMTRSAQCICVKVQWILCNWTLHRADCSCNVSWTPFHVPIVFCVKIGVEILVMETVCNSGCHRICSLVYMTLWVCLVMEERENVLSPAENIFLPHSICSPKLVETIYTTIVPL